MATITSTVPGAIAVLQTHLVNIQAALPALDLGVYFGIPPERANNNLITIGHYETGEVISGYHQTWSDLPLNGGHKSETYELIVSARTWAGDTDPLGRLQDIFTVVDALASAVEGDPQAALALTPSGVWEVSSVELPEQGPFGAKGWGVWSLISLSITNVRLTTT